MAFPILAVLFDLDGVLVNSPLNLPAIKRELFGDAKVFIIEGLEALPESERAQKSELLLQRELEAAGRAKLDPSVPDLFAWLEERDLKRGVITRNARDVVDLIQSNLGVDFGVVIAREDAPPKPHPACIFEAARKLEVPPQACVMVGDFRFDIEAGKAAGCKTVFVETDEFRHLRPGEDVRIASLGELRGVLESWMREA